MWYNDYVLLREEIKNMSILLDNMKKKVIVSAWNSDKCPCCHAELSESLGDGYYSHPTFLERCPKCLQKLVWDE